MYCQVAAWQKCENTHVLNATQWQITLHSCRQRTMLPFCSDLFLDDWRILPVTSYVCCVWIVRRLQHQGFFPRNSLLEGMTDLVISFPIINISQHSLAVHSKTPKGESKEGGVGESQGETRRVLAHWVGIRWQEQERGAEDNHVTRAEPGWERAPRRVGPTCWTNRWHRKLLGERVRRKTHLKTEKHVRPNS